MGNEYEREITVLGSVANLGPVLLFDDIEDLFKWTEGGTGGDTVFEKIATVAYNGSASLHMKTRTAFAVENDSIKGYRNLFGRPGKRNRLECLFMVDAAAQCNKAYFELAIYDGTNLHSLGLRWISATTKWEYLNSVGSETDVPGGSQGLAADSFHRLLLEWDEESGEYIRMICDGLEISLAGISYYKTANAAASVVRLDLGMLAGATPPGEIYFDDVLVLEI